MPFEKALGTFRGWPKALSVAILDHLLSDGDSSRVCERIKERNIPFVTYSGYDHPRGPCLGGVHIRKPASMSLLVTTVKGLLAQRPVLNRERHLRVLQTLLCSG
jgi:hypothetical protein